MPNPPIGTITTAQRPPSLDSTSDSTPASQEGQFNEHTVTKTETPPRPHSHDETPAPTKSLSDYTVTQETTEPVEATAQASATSAPKEESITIGTITIPPVTKEQGEKFEEMAFQCGRSSNTFSFGLNTQIKDIIGDKPLFDLQNPYSEMYSESGSPNHPRNRSVAATQVEHNGKKELTANHVYMNGREVGIAMQHPTKENMPVVLETLLAPENNVTVMVDLVSQKNRDDSVDKPGQPFDWGTVESEEFGDFTVTKQSEDFTELPLNDEGDTGILTGRKFEVKTKDGETKNITVLSFPNWPDGDMVDISVLHYMAGSIAELREETGGNVAVNCMGGLGRTGTLMTAVDMYESFSTLDTDALGKEVLSRIIQGRASRNNEFVQRPQQAQGLLDYAYAITAPQGAEAEQTA